MLLGSDSCKIGTCSGGGVVAEVGGIRGSLGRGLTAAPG